jgi:hypothetical protein
MANHWPPIEIPGRVLSAGGKFRLRLVLVEPGLCSPDLKRGARGLVASLCVAGYCLSSSYHAVLHPHYFQLLRSQSRLIHSGLWKPRTDQDSGIHRNPQPSVGSGDNSACRGQPPECAGSEFRKPGRGGRCGDIPGVQAGKSLRPLRHPHNQKRRIRPAKLPP